MVGEKIKTYKVVDVPTQVEKVFIEQSTGKQYDLYEVINKIANDIELIKKSVE